MDRNGQYNFFVVYGDKFFHLNRILPFVYQFGRSSPFHRVKDQALKPCRACESKPTVFCCPFCFKFFFTQESAACQILPYTLAVSYKIFVHKNRCLFSTFVKSENKEAHHKTVKGGLNIFFSIYLFSKANLIFIYILYIYLLSKEALPCRSSRPAQCRRRLCNQPLLLFSRMNC